MYMRFRMSLSARKHKTKIGDDPQNLNWRNDDNQIGQRLMKKMVSRKICAFMLHVPVTNLIS